MIGVLLHNIVVYVIRLLAIGRWIGYVKDAEDSDFDDLESMNMWIAIIIHIIIPAVFLLLVACFNLKYTENGLMCAAFYVGHVLFFFYCLFFLIQTFWLGAVASIALFVTRILMPPKGYKKVPQQNNNIVNAVPVTDNAISTEENRPMVEVMAEPTRLPPIVTTQFRFV